jgi:hypothetical protein
VRHDAWLDLHVQNATTRTSLAALNPKALAVKGMPAIMNYNFLPDMGRMNL